MLVVLFFIGVPTRPASGGFSHENINRGQNLQCTAALLNTVHAKLYPGHTVIRSPFCRWIERSDVHWEWTNVVRAWIESWMPLAWGLVSAAALCCLALKKATLCSFFSFSFVLRFLFQDCVSFSSLIVVILFLGFLSHRHFTKLPTRSAEKDLFLLIIIKGICVCSTLSAWGVTAIITISKNNMSLLEGFHYQQHKQNKNIKSDRRLKGTVQRKLVINYRTPCCWRVGWSVVTFLELHSKNSVAAFS